ncbi:hypothetical protein [Paraburkholderia sp. J69-1]|nr:hypothetical protein [Paraburkholderia sp. J69-1]
MLINAAPAQIADLHFMIVAVSMCRITMARAACRRGALHRRNPDLIYL